LATPENFNLVTTPVPVAGPGYVVVRNTFFSVDPYMRPRMDDVPSYIPPFTVGKALDGGAVGEVVSSGDPALSPGDMVLHSLGWREFAVLPAKHARKVDASAAPSESLFLGALGMPGLTAYVGLLDIAGMKPGDSVFVSAAAGAVGSLAGQIARLRGASRVIGSAGSAAKVAYLTDTLGFDAAFDYHDGRVSDSLKRVAPDGIDVYFDNVGADHLEAAIARLHPYGRIALCGAVAQYNAESAPIGPRNLSLAIGKRLTLRGYIVTDHQHRMPEFAAEVGGWLRAGQIVCDETVVDGIENAVDAFLGLLRGGNTGKMLIRV
jgi:NADPH-dependent curcumin reductase CurA